jgi:hypothetical protein
MLALDIDQALRFLDALDPSGRHTLASEAPFGGPDNGAKWEQGATFEARQRPWLIKDIKERQGRGSNVYYSVNRPCPVTERQGWAGKNNVDDIIAIRALAFDVDITQRPFDNALLVDFVDNAFTGALRPSLLISTGGGFQIIYILENAINVALFRPATNDEESQANDKSIADRRAVTKLAQDFELLLRQLIPSQLKDHIKIDNMSNIDRVMRLPGTVNYPKAEKIAKGQVPALAHVAIDYRNKCNIFELRKQVPKITAAPSFAPRKPYVQRPNSKWPPYRKALICCEFLRDKGAADTNEIYTKEVMLPLIGSMHDGDLTVEEAEKCFLEAISGGARYGTMGRGMGYFKRQFKSHLGSRRSGHRTLGSLIAFCKSLGMALPWKDEVSWEDDFLRQLKELSETKTIVDITDLYGEKQCQKGE